MGQPLADCETRDVGEPVEEIAGAIGLPGLGDFLQGQNEKKDGGGEGDPTRKEPVSTRLDGEIAEQGKRADKNQVAPFVAMGDLMDEGPPLVALATVGDADDGEE